MKARNLSIDYWLEIFKYTKYYESNGTRLANCRFRNIWDKYASELPLPTFDGIKFFPIACTLMPIQKLIVVQKLPSWPEEHSSLEDCITFPPLFHIDTPRIGQSVSGGMEVQLRCGARIYQVLLPIRPSSFQELLLTVFCTRMLCTNYYRKFVVQGIVINWQFLDRFYPGFCFNSDLVKIKFSKLQLQLMNTGIEHYREFFNRHINTKVLSLYSFPNCAELLFGAPLGNRISQIKKIVISESFFHDGFIDKIIEKLETTKLSIEVRAPINYFMIWPQDFRTGERIGTRPERENSFWVDYAYTARSGLTHRLSILHKEFEMGVKMCGVAVEPIE